MGYMGFGMRKEVYNRKPKEAFKRVKKLHEPKAKEGDGSGFKASKNYHENQFKQLRDRKWFKVLSLISTLLLLWFIVEIFIMDDIKYRHKAYLFEKRGIEVYYQNHEKDIDQLVSFIESQNGKIARIQHSRIMVRSENFYDSIKSRPHKGHHVGYDYHGKMLPLEILDGNIKFKKQDHFRTFKQYWTLDLTIYQVSDFPESILAHINTNKQELDEVLRFISEQDFELNTGQEGLMLTFWRYQKPYTLLVCNNIDQIQERSTKEFVKLKGNLYYTHAEIKKQLLDRSKKSVSKRVKDGH